MRAAPRMPIPIFSIALLFYCPLSLGGQTYWGQGGFNRHKRLLAAPHSQQDIQWKQQPGRIQCQHQGQMWGGVGVPSLVARASGYALCVSPPG